MCFTIVYHCSILIINSNVMPWFYLVLLAVFSVNLNSSHRKNSHFKLNITVCLID